jgi:hypothetical protein
VISGTFQLKAAYIDGAKAALEGDSVETNPHFDDARHEWDRGYYTVASGRALESYMDRCCRGGEPYFSTSV